MFKILNVKKQKIKESKYANVKLHKKIKKLKRDKLELLVNLVTSVLKTLRKELKIFKKNKTSIIINEEDNDFIIDLDQKNEVVYKSKYVSFEKLSRIINLKKVGKYLTVNNSDILAGINSQAKIPEPSIEPELQQSETKDSKVTLEPPINIQKKAILAKKTQPQPKKPKSYAKPKNKPLDPKSNNFST